MYKRKARPQAIQTAVYLYVMISSAFLLHFIVEMWVYLIEIILACMAALHNQLGQHHEPVNVSLKCLASAGQ